MHQNNFCDETAEIITLGFVCVSIVASKAKLVIQNGKLSKILFKTLMKTM